MSTLETFGWSDFFASQLHGALEPGQVVGRVVADYGGYLKVVTPEERKAEVAGKLKFSHASHELPKVGDWVVLQTNGDDRATITHVLIRKSEVSRKASGGKVGKQILAANIDVAFIVQALDGDFNIARLERYIYQLHQAKIDPVLIFNKADLAVDLAAQLQQVGQLAVPYIVTNARNADGIQQVQDKIQSGCTAVFLGSSGVGKSTLTNLLLGEDRQLTGERRENDARGRHTTSYRELFVLPGGGLIIDTPGIRELQLWGEEEVLLASFTDIVALASDCEFRNCSHTKERHCAVQAAVKNGTLASARLESYRKLQLELQQASEQKSISDSKLQKQRSRRMRQTIATREKLQDDSRLY